MKHKNLTCSRKKDAIFRVSIAKLFQIIKKIICTSQKVFFLQPNFMNKKCLTVIITKYPLFKNTDPLLTRRTGMLLWAALMTSALDSSPCLFLQNKPVVY